MTVKEYMHKNGIQTDEGLRLHFLTSMRTGKIPVAMYSCPVCGEILTTEDFICPKCKPKKH